ncbi:MAG TPA: hypothetical protein PK079_23880 [Leptospiraceae bacterium]|nr:hypothetical protein [Leptospiraceae bacterium]HMW08420.1 hypothetical protein [Leptospiraceae bacterium]HNC59779.1 hypothetical protein [Leptospiraceae bacterium]HNE56224.1 hypothetical protein [Leptospiraceae bacterium]HNF57562.1 hypothetical protein [Leptospiraceae bacterium]
MVESPFSALKGVRELQYAMSEYSAWLQYVCINGQEDSTIQKGWLSDKYSQVKGFLGKLVERKQPDFVYPDEEGEVFDEWSDNVFDFLQTDWNAVYREYHAQSTVVSMIAEYMLNRHDRDMTDYSLPEINKALQEVNKPDLNNLDELYRDEEIVGKRNYKQLYAETAGANWIAVYKDGERQGKCYETMRDIYRKIMVEAFETGKPVDELRKKFINIESLLPENLDEESRQEIINEHLNRDFFRLAVTEANIAEGNGRLLSAIHHGHSYGKIVLGGGRSIKSRSAYRNRSKKVGYQSCSKCLELTTYTYRVFSSEAEFKKSKYYGGEDDLIGDDKADKALWVGKNNVGRSYDSWWGTPGAIHPYCSCMFRVTQTMVDDDLGDDDEDYSVEAMQKGQVLHEQGLHRIGIFQEHTCSHEPDSMEFIEYILRR